MHLFAILFLPIFGFGFLSIFCLPSLRPRGASGLSLDIRPELPPGLDGNRMGDCVSLGA
jgi:hypothetical protein